MTTKKPLAEILVELGKPHTEFRGEFTAVCTHALTHMERARLWDASDYLVRNVCGPYVEMLKLTSE